MSKFIYGFWLSYGLIKIKISESSTPCTITPDVNKETIFPAKLLLKDIPKHWVGIAHQWCVVIIIITIIIIIIIILTFIIILFPPN